MNQKSKMTDPHMSYSRIFYFEHACPKLDFVLISRLTGKHAKKVRISSL